MAAAPNTAKDKDESRTPWQKVRVPVIVLACMGVIFGLMKISHIEFNLTESMPVGFYQRVDSSIQRGNLVSACLPESIAKIGLKRGYLMSGACPGNAIAVLKKVIAVPGDTVNVSEQDMIIGLHTYHAPVEAFDHLGRPVQRFISNGIYHVKNTVWLYGSHSPLHSWDSRYYGGVPLKNIKGVYKPLLTF